MASQWVESRPLALVHAFRAVTEIATWDHDRSHERSGHPWIAMRDVLEAQLASLTD